MNFADDLEVMSRLGWPPDAINRLSDRGFAPGDLGTFFALEPDTRALVLRLLDHPSDEEHAELAAHPAGRALAEWLLTLPAYREVNDDQDAGE